MLKPHLAMWVFAVGMVVLSADVVCAQDYPIKPIRIVTGGAGGGSDFESRLIAQGISGPLGQPVIVDNRVVVVGREIVMKAPPDGYTLLVLGSVLWLAPLLGQGSYYDAVNDFSPISLMSRNVFVVAVHPSLPVKSVKELIAFAKSKPGMLNYSSPPAGGSPHLAAELFKSMAGDLNVVNVPYKGPAPAVTALVGGEVHMTIIDAGLLLPHVKSGKLRALAVTSAQPTALAPGLPTVAAAGVPGYEAGGITGIWAPAKTPAAIINRLNHEIVRVLGLPDVRERLLDVGEEVVGSSPEQFLTTIKSDITRMSKIIKAVIKAD